MAMDVSTRMNVSTLLENVHVATHGHEIEEERK